MNDHLWQKIITKFVISYIQFRYSQFHYNHVKSTYTGGRMALAIRSFAIVVLIYAQIFYVQNFESVS